MTRREDESRAAAWLAGRAAGTPGPCPDPSLLVGLAERRLLPAEQGGVLAHLEGCETCRDLVGVALHVREERAAAAPGAGPSLLRSPWPWAAAALVLLALGAGWRLLARDDGPAPGSVTALSAVAADLARARPDLFAGFAPVAPADLRAAPRHRRGTFEVLAPAGRAPERPVITWSEVPGARAYEVAVLDEEGAVVWSAASESTSALYPPDRPPLAKGARYVVEVRARGVTTETTQRAFAVPSAADDARLGAGLAAIDARGGPLAPLAKAHWALREGDPAAALPFAEAYAAAAPDDAYGRATLAHARALLGR